MTKISSKHIQCTGCRRTQNFSIYESVNTDVSPELKAAVEDLSIFRFSCDYCGHNALVSHDFLYHVPDAPYAIWYLPNGLTERHEQALNAFSRMVSSDYALRLVFSHHELLELVKIANIYEVDWIVNHYKLAIELVEIESGRNNHDWYFVRKDERRGVYIYESPELKRAIPIPWDPDKVSELKRAFKTIDSRLGWVHLTTQKVMEVWPEVERIISTREHPGSASSADHKISETASGRSGMGHSPGGDLDQIARLINAESTKSRQTETTSQIGSNRLSDSANIASQNRGGYESKIEEELEVSDSVTSRNAHGIFVLVLVISFFAAVFFHNYRWSKPSMSSPAQPPSSHATIQQESFTETYTIVLGSYPGIEHARMFQDSLNKLGFAAGFERLNINGVQQYRVQIGPVRGLEETQEIRQRLSNAGLDSQVISGSN